MSARSFVATAVAACCVSLSGAQADAGPAYGSPEGSGVDLVGLGDSFMADPNPLLAKLSGFTSPNTAPNEDPLRGCVQNLHGYLYQAGEMLRMSVGNFSCAGASSVNAKISIVDEVTRALETGALGPDTKRVVITLGFNDTRQVMYRQKSWEEVRATHLAVMREQIQRIRAAAPHARIQLLGYPEITSDGFVCLFHVVPGISDRTWLPLAKELEDKAQELQATLAALEHVEFIDAKPSTRGRGMCGSDDARLVASFIDSTGAHHEYPFHLNEKGHVHMAGLIVNS